MTDVVSAARLRALLDLDAAPGYRELADHVRLLLVDGRLPVGARLPSERTLAEALGVSRTTTTRAYADLRERGYATARQGSGTTVRLPLEGRTAMPLADPSYDGVRPRSPGDPIVWSVAAGRAAPGVAAAYGRAVERLPPYLQRSGYAFTGLPEVRAALAERYTRRGLPTRPEQILVTSGAQSAISLLAHGLGGSRRRVLVEAPTYANALDTVRRHRLRPVPVPMLDDVGEPRWDLAGFAAAAPGADWAYLMPDFQNPTGALMPAEQRARLGRSLLRQGCVPVVDETMADLALDGSPAPGPFAAHAPGTVTVGSASKAFWGGLRVGWVRAEPGLIDRLVRARHTSDLGTAVLEQLVLVELLEAEAEVRAEVATSLRVQRDRLRDLLADRLPGWQPTCPGGGLMLWVGLPGRFSSRLAVAAERHGLLIPAGPRYYAEAGGENRVRLPFTREDDDLAESVRRLAAAAYDLPERLPTQRPAALTA